MPTEEQKDDVLYAARAGDVEALNETLAEIGQDRKAAIQAALDVTNDGGNTPLHFAAANGHQDVLAVLLPEAHLAALLRQNHAGNTPLHWASFNGHVAVAQELADRTEALEKTEPQQAQTLRAAEDDREMARHDQARPKDQTEDQIQQERERHEEQQRERALWDIRNEAGRGPMSEAQMADREDVVQMLLKRLAKQDTGNEADPQAADGAPAPAPVADVATKTAQLDLQ